MSIFKCHFYYEDLFINSFRFFIKFISIKLQLCFLSKLNTPFIIFFTKRNIY